MLGRWIAVLFYAALGFLLLAFIFSNREPVELSLFPLGFVAEMPLYLALSLLFALGLLLGLSYAGLLSLGHLRRARRDSRLIAQLENELSAYRETKALP